MRLTPSLVLGCLVFPCLEVLAFHPITSWVDDLSRGYKRRLAADPNFPIKSVFEVFVAAGTQFAAEYQRRGANHLISEIDFVSAGVLTAVYGKYSSMWKTAPTLAENNHITNDNSSSSHEPLSAKEPPTNAFQPFLLDGKTRPSIQQRIQSFLIPMGPLFRAGVFAGLVGYGFTSIMIAFRTWLLPSYVAATKNVNIAYASLYTGCFMAVVSNVRYQLMQGVLEPFVEKLFGRLVVLKALAIFAIRIGNGFLGSMLAIAGMNALGLQKLK